MFRSTLGIGGQRLNSCASKTSLLQLRFSATGWMARLLRLLSVGILGLLVLSFGAVLIVMGASMFLPNGTFGFAFGVGRRAFTVAVVALLTFGAMVVIFFARTLRRR